MFDVRFLVEDKKLPKALYAIDGLVHNLAVIPVRDAEVSNGEVRSTAKPGGPVAALIAAMTEIPKGTIIKSPELEDAVVAAGGRKASLSYFVKKLKEAKVLRAAPGKGKGRGYVKL